MRGSGKNGLGLSLGLVKVVGFQIAAILRLFSTKGLNLVHGSLRPENIYFTKKDVPEFKLLDFSCAFFLDETPKHLAELRNGSTAPELKDCAGFGNSWEGQESQLSRLDQWDLGTLLFKLHFKESVDPKDVNGSFRRVLQELNLPK